MNKDMKLCLEKLKKRSKDLNSQLADFQNIIQFVELTAKNHARNQLEQEGLKLPDETD
jgi:hypothetical protein